MKKNKFLNILILIFILSCNFCSTINIRNSENTIRNDLLKNTPLGSSREDVRKFINKNNYKIYEDRYFYTKAGKSVIDGRIDVSLGKYGIILDTGVGAVWIFDKKDLLIDVVVQKNVNSL